MSNEVKVIVPATNTTPEKKFKVSVKNNSGGPGMMAAITAAANKAVAAIAPQPAPQPPNNSMRVVQSEDASPLPNEENANLSEGGRRRNKRKGTRRNKRKGSRRNKRKGTRRNKRKGTRRNKRN